MTNYFNTIASSILEFRIPSIFRMLSAETTTYRFKTFFDLDAFLIRHLRITGNHHAKAAEMIANRLHDEQYLAFSQGEEEIIVLIAVSAISLSLCRRIQTVHTTHNLQNIYTGSSQTNLTYQFGRMRTLLPSSLHLYLVSSLFLLSKG